MEPTAAVVDSAAVATHVAGIVGPAVRAWLESALPGVRPEVLALAGQAASSAAVIVALALLRWTVIGFTKGSRVGAELVAPLWDRNKGWLNPLLAIVLGHFDGSALAGALAVALHAGYRGTAKAIGKATPQEVARAARAGVFLLACGGALWAADASAGVASLLRPVTRQDAPMPAFARERFALSLGVGAQAGGWVYSRGTQGFAEVQASYQWTNALGLRVGARRVAVARAPVQPEARLVLTFAP